MSYTKCHCMSPPSSYAQVAVCVGDLSEQSLAFLGVQGCSLPLSLLESSSLAAVRVGNGEYLARVFLRPAANPSPASAAVDAAKAQLQALGLDLSDLADIEGKVAPAAPEPAAAAPVSSPTPRWVPVLYKVSRVWWGSPGVLMFVQLDLVCCSFGSPGMPLQLRRPMV